MLTHLISLSPSLFLSLFSSHTQTTNHQRPTTPPLRPAPRLQRARDRMDRSIGGWYPHKTPRDLLPASLVVPANSSADGSVGADMDAARGNRSGQGAEDEDEAAASAALDDGVDADMDVDAEEEGADDDGDGGAGSDRRDLSRAAGRAHFAAYFAEVAAEAAQARVRSRMRGGRTLSPKYIAKFARVCKNFLFS